MGPGAKGYILKVYNKILSTSDVPASFKKAKIIAFNKPGKDGSEANHYRPISLLSNCYKLLERLIYNRIAPVIDKVLPKQQAGFRPRKSCCEQVKAHTTFIESGFQKKTKTAGVFIDLTAAYDTVWRKGLMLKFCKIIPCSKLNS